MKSVLFFLAALLMLTSAGRAQPAALPPIPPESHQFDFWIGDWDVFDRTSGKKIGENRIDSLWGGRALQENWHGAGGGTGTSLNIYDAPNKQWQQTWMDGFDGVANFYGALVDREMIMTAKVWRKGTPMLYRGTWTPQADGSVRQHFELSSDDGKTWQNEFDGIYRRKK